LQIQQIDSALAKLKNTYPHHPTTGWARTIRESLGISVSALARRLGVTPHSISKLEKAEADAKITLASLHKLANALDCEVQYTLVPRKPLEEILKDRALLVARERLQPISHSMALENQAVGKQIAEKQIKLLAQEILDGPRRNLWW
jgi:predicted DNA-binding mobile mystery protein A